MSKRILLALICSIVCLVAGCSHKGKPATKTASYETDLFVEYDDAYFAEYGERLRAAEAYKERYTRTLPEDLFGSWSNRNAASRRRNVSETADSQPGARRRLLRAAHSAIGTPYVVGGTHPGGFDCSGLVCWAYGNIGVKLPRTAREQSVVGQRIGRVEDMREGDIVAFRHPRRGYHTGIYVGNGKFIHSPRRKSFVKINSLEDPYFHDTFLGARRVNLTGREDLLAQAERRLQDDEFPVYSHRRHVYSEGHKSSRNAGRNKRSRDYTAVADNDSGKRYSSKRRHALEQEKRGRQEERSLKKNRHKLIAEQEKDVSSKRKGKRDRDQVEEKSSRKRQVAVAEKDRGRKDKRKDDVTGKRENRKSSGRETLRSDSGKKDRKTQETASFSKQRVKKQSKVEKKKRSSRS